MLAFYLSIFVLWVLGIFWICFRGGAEYLVNHPGVVNIKSVFALKILFCSLFLGGIFEFISMGLEVSRNRIL